MEWEEPLWLFYRKHRPPPRLPWPKIVAASEYGPAYYRPDLLDQIAQLEMQCVTQGQQFGHHPHIRDYWLKHDIVVGASKGKETEYLFAAWAQNGEVHGRPITVEELRKKGARL